MKQNIGKIHPKVINLSSRDLTTDEIKLLSYGPKFAPTPSTDTEGLKNDVKEFCRKLRLTEFFHKNPVQQDASITKAKSSFNPGRNRNILLDAHIDCLSKYPMNTHPKQKNNLKKEEWKALQSLKNDNTIVIKEADKGGAFVIMDTTYYEHEMNQLLDDKETYKKMANHSDEVITKKIQAFVKKYQKNLTAKEAKYLLELDPKASNIYGLPKVHKCKGIIQMIEQKNTAVIALEAPKDLKFRPIVAGPMCPTSRLSEMLDNILKPCLEDVKSYIKDTADFVTKLPKKDYMSDSDVMVTLDVESLYTNIDNTLGKTAVAHWIEKCRHKIPTRFNKNMILEATDIVLKNNTFQFNRQWFIQTSGTAMGTKMAPTYATITLGYLEEIMYEQAEKETGKEFRKYLEDIWKRFLDDCFIVWKTMYGPISKLTDMLNSLHRKIHFTVEIGNEALPFLNILLTKQGNIIKTDLYRKPTDTQNYLPFNSAHPHSTKINLPYNLARQIVMLVEDKETRELHFTALHQHLKLKGYPSAVINSGIAKAKTLSQQDLFGTKKDNRESKTIAWVHDYNPNNPNLTELMKRTVHTLSKSDSLQGAFANVKIVAAKRQPANLKRLLTRAKFSTGPDIFEVKRCKANCATCRVLREGSSYVFNNIDMTFHLKSNFTCTTKNLIYALQCEHCGAQYIGETGGELRLRINVHRQQIRDDSLRHLNVSKHLFACSNGKFNVFPFYKMHHSSDIDRKTKELYFITKYKPELNKE